MNAMEYLKPGGVAVHTMEFTLSNAVPQGQRFGSTSLWTKADLTGLARDLCALGYEVMPFRYKGWLGVGSAASVQGVFWPAYVA